MGHISDHVAIESVASGVHESRTTLKALLLDDDPLDCALVARLAVRSIQFDIKLTTCRTIEEAERALKRVDFDIAFVDYWLGFDTAISFIHEHARLSRTAIVLLTSLDVPDIRRVAFRAGVEGYLGKDNLSIQAIEGVICTVLSHKNQLS